MKAKRKLKRKWAIVVPTMFLVFKAIHPQNPPITLTRTIPDMLGYLDTCISPNRMVETSNATFQPFHLLNEKRIRPLNTISCPKPLSAQRNKLNATISHELIPGESFKSATMNLVKEKAKTKIIEFPRLGSARASFSYWHPHARALNPHIPTFKGH